MQRLFTAIAVPEAMAKRLVALQPPVSDYVRLLEIDQLHVTLHFIGQADTGAVANILKLVRSPSFSLRIAGLGKFVQSDGALVLWAGIQHDENLVQLYRCMADVLAPGGYVKSANNYLPHITLARCKKNTPPEIGDLFLSQAVPAFDSFQVTEFSLYSSTLLEDKSVYRREADFLFARSGLSI